MVTTPSYIPTDRGRELPSPLVRADAWTRLCACRRPRGCEVGGHGPRMPSGDLASALHCGLLVCPVATLTALGPTAAGPPS